MAKTSATKAKAKKAVGTKAKPAKKAAVKPVLVASNEGKQTGPGSNARVEINKEKPGKGNFVVRVEGRNKPVLELLGMKRPFAALKALDMDDVGKSVMDALSCNDAE
eukprot:CCRYP_020470-RA/>CCRYP_020470-RA protein AED:0.49 eAED:1.00 QI:0/0/0/1/1/1/2/0/106